MPMISHNYLLLLVDGYGLGVVLLEFEFVLLFEDDGVFGLRWMLFWGVLFDDEEEILSLSLSLSISISLFGIYI